MTQHAGELVAMVERELQRVGIDLVVEQDGKTLILAGSVETEADRQAALEIAAGLIGDDVQLEDDIEVTGLLPQSTQNAVLSESEVAGFRGADSGAAEDESVMPGDFTDQDTLFSPDDAQSASLSDADVSLGGREDLASDGDAVYVPPTDPVGTDTQVIGGFGGSSMDEIDVDRSSDGTIGDEAIRDAVLRELREDAATTGLVVEVEVEEGVVTLRGKVADLDDVESAEEVSARVPGVVEVIEEFEVEGLTDT
jgi:osmotically-inducible protein OsmY